MGAAFIRRLLVGLIDKLYGWAHPRVTAQSIISQIDNPCVYEYTAKDLYEDESLREAESLRLTTLGQYLILGKQNYIRAQELIIAECS